MNIDILSCGDKLRCIEFDGWIDEDTDADVGGPSGDDIVTVRRIGVKMVAYTWVPVVWLEEFPGDDSAQAFWLESFVPIENGG